MIPHVPHAVPAGPHRPVLRVPRICDLVVYCYDWRGNSETAYFAPAAVRFPPDGIERTPAVVQSALEPGNPETSVKLFRLGNAGYFINVPYGRAQPHDDYRHWWEWP